MLNWVSLFFSNVNLEKWKLKGPSNQRTFPLQTSRSSIHENRKKRKNIVYSDVGTSRTQNSNVIFTLGLIGLLPLQVGSVPLHWPLERQVNSEYPVKVYPELHENCTRVFTVVAVVDLEPLGGVLNILHDVTAANIKGPFGQGSNKLCRAVKLEVRKLPRINCADYTNKNCQTGKPLFHVRFPWICVSFKIWKFQLTYWVYFI